MEVRTLIEAAERLGDAIAAIEGIIRQGRLGAAGETYAETILDDGADAMEALRRLAMELDRAAVVKYGRVD